jgi:hypothetical protein
MRSTAISAVLILVFACTALAQDEVFSDDFETGLPYSWSSWQAWTPSVEIEPDFAGLASQYVEPEDGATIEAVGSDGTEYRLTIPPDALMKPVVIIMIPIAAIPNLPLTDGLGAGVELLPDGLTFFKPATLEITPASGTVPDTAVGFAFKENGQGFHLYPHLEESGTVTIPITGFSGYGFGLAGDLSPLSSNDWMTEAAYLNEIARKHAEIAKDVVPDPAVVAEIKQLLRLWHENVVMTTADAVLLEAAQGGANMAELLTRAAQQWLLWDRVVVDLLAHIFPDPYKTFDLEYDEWEAFATGYCNQVEAYDTKCGNEKNICDSFDQIPDLVEVQNLLGLLPGSLFNGCIYSEPGICQGLNEFRLESVEMQCSDKIPVGGSTQLVAVPKSWTGQDVGKAHLSNPAGGSPIEWAVNDPSIASLAGIASELEVTAQGNAEGTTLVGVTLTQCERKVTGRCPVEVGEPLRVRIGDCDWNSTSCHLPSLAGGSTTVDVEALFEGAEPTDQIQIAVQPYRPLGDIDIVSGASSCSQFPGDWGGLGCAGTAAPGERFTVGLTGLEPEFPVFAVHVKAQFEGAERETVVWAYSTDICYSEADYGVYPFSAPTATGTLIFSLPEPGISAPDSFEAEIGMLSAATTCSSYSLANAIGGWWDTLLVIPKDLRLFDALLDTGGELETPITGAGSANARAGKCTEEYGDFWVSAQIGASGSSVNWSWDLFPHEGSRGLFVEAHDRCRGEPWSDGGEVDLIVNPHVFGKPVRLTGFGQISCVLQYAEVTGYGHARGSATWDVVTAATWEGDYLSLHDFRIFSCSGEFDLNWPP